MPGAASRWWRRRSSRSPSATQNATEEIGRKIDQLQRDAQESIAAVNRIMAAIAAIRPVFSTIASAIEEQIATTGELSRSAADASRFVTSVTSSAAEIGSASARAQQSGVAIDRSGEDAANLAAKLQTRFVTFLRQSEIGDRRRHDRLPCDVAVVLRQGGREFRGQTVDLSEGGMLVRGSGTEKLVRRHVGRRGTDRHRPHARAHRRPLGARTACRIRRARRRAWSARCTSASTRSGRRTRSSSIARSTRAAMVSMALEEAVDIRHAHARGAVRHRLSADRGHQPAAVPHPRARRAGSAAAADPGAAAGQRQAHDLLRRGRPQRLSAGAQPIYSKPQKPDDPAWNVANCRNRRIFDDRAGLCAARNVRPYLIQSYPRDMGNGVVIMMREIDAPIRVFGKHWGGFRTAYKI